MIDGIELKIDTNILDNNISLFREQLNTTTQIIAVIKANGYGCGLVQIGKYLENKGIEMFAVVSIQEAVELRKGGISNPILILGATFEEDFKYLVEYDLMQATIDYEYAKSIHTFALNNNTKVKVHIKVNSGLNRLGIENIDEILSLYTMEGLSIEGIYTHFASAQRYESEEENFTQKQIDTFKEVLRRIEALGYSLKTTHIQNSPSVIHLGDLGFSAVRCGMVLFGLFHPEQLEIAFSTGYRPIYTLESKILVVRNLTVDNYIGYGRTYKTLETEKIATVGAGYCDGVFRTYSQNQGTVNYKGIQLPIVGDIAMSQCFINATDTDLKRLDTVTFFNSGDKSLYTYISKSKQTINEFISGLRDSIPRIYE